MGGKLRYEEFEVPINVVANKEGSIIKIQRHMQSKLGKDLYLRFEFNPMKLVGIVVTEREKDD